MRMTIWSLVTLALAGCGNFSQARLDDLDLIKTNTVHVVTREHEDKLTASELRIALETIDKAALGELAHKGKEADLEAARAKRLKESDDATAALFNGDNGRE